MEDQRLCKACQAIFAKTEYQIYTHTLGGFQESATNGCHFRAMRWDGLSPEQRSKLLKYEHRIEVQYYNESRTGNVPMLRFRYALEREGENVSLQCPNTHATQLGPNGTSRMHGDLFVGSSTLTPFPRSWQTDRLSSPTGQIHVNNGYGAVIL